MAAPAEGTVIAARMVGMAGTRVFTVEALTPGTVTFRAANARSWEFPGFD